MLALHQERGNFFSRRFNPLKLPLPACGKGVGGWGSLSRRCAQRRGSRTPPLSPILIQESLNRFLVPFAGANADNFLDRRDEDFTIPNLAGAGGRDDFVYYHIDLIVVNNNFDFELLQELDGVLGTPVSLGLAFLTPKASDFGNGHADNAGVDQGDFDFIQFKWPYNGFYLFQARRSLVYKSVSFL